MAQVASSNTGSVSVTATTVRTWLRAPLLPALDRAVYVNEISDEERPQPGGVFQPLGASLAVVVAGVRQAGGLSARFVCLTRQDRVELLALLDAGTTLYLTTAAEGGTDLAVYVRPVGSTALTRVAPADPTRYVGQAFAVVGRP